MSTNADLILAERKSRKNKTGFQIHEGRTTSKKPDLSKSSDLLKIAGRPTSSCKIDYISVGRTMPIEGIFDISSNPCVPGNEKAIFRAEKMCNVLESDINKGHSNLPQPTTSGMVPENLSVNEARNVIKPDAMLERKVIATHMHTRASERPKRPSKAEHISEAPSFAPVKPSCRVSRLKEEKICEPSKSRVKTFPKVRVKLGRRAVKDEQQKLEVENERLKLGSQKEIYRTEKVKPRVIENIDLDDETTEEADEGDSDSHDDDFVLYIDSDTDVDDTDSQDHDIKFERTRDDGKIRRNTKETLAKPSTSKISKNEPKGSQWKTRQEGVPKDNFKAVTQEKRHFEHLEIITLDDDDDIDDKESKVGVPFEKNNSLKGPVTENIVDKMKRIESGLLEISQKMKPGESSSRIAIHCVKDTREATGDGLCDVKETVKGEGLAQKSENSDALNLKDSAKRDLNDSLLEFERTDAQLGENKLKPLSISTTSREEDSNDTSSLTSPILPNTSLERKSRPLHRKKPFGLSRKRLLSKRSVSGTSEDGSLDRSTAKKAKPQAKSGITYEIGQKLEAMDFQKKWYLAKIIEVDSEASEILIHFDGWSSRYDEWVAMDSKKLRPTLHPTTRKDSRDKTLKKNLVYKPGESILARWTDGKMYPGTVKEVLPENYFTVIFYDGFTKKLSYSSISKLPADKEKFEKWNFPLPLSQVRKMQNEMEQPQTLVPVQQGIPPPPVIVPTKAFVIKEDHNQFKCEIDGCNKSFRKENLLKSHVKHYHGKLSKGRSDAYEKSRPFRRFRKEPKVKSIELPLEEKTVETASTEIEIVSEKVEEETPNLNIKTETHAAEEIALESPHIENEPSKGEEGRLAADPALEPVVQNEQVKAEIKLEVTDEPNVVVVSPTKEKKPKDPSLKRVVTSTPVSTRSHLAKVIHPVTKMETRHAKLCYYKDDSIYTSYKSVAFGHQSSRNLQGFKHEKVRSPKESVKETRQSMSSKSGKADDVKGRGKSGQDGNSKQSGESKVTSVRRGPNKRKTDTALQAIKEKNEVIKRMKLEAELEEDVLEIKRQMPQSAPRKRSERVSECTVISKIEDTQDDLTETTDASLGTVEDVEDVADDEVVHCICECNEENGLMIQCEICLTWQHGSCFKIEELDQVPEKYTCYACLNPRGLRDSFKYRPDYNWFKDGEVPFFQCIGGKSLPFAKSNAIQRTHSLMTNMLNIQNVLHGMRHKMNILKSGSTDNPDLKHFSKSWRPSTATNKNVSKLNTRSKICGGLTLDPDETESVLNALEKEAQPPSRNVTSNFSPSKGFTSFDHSYFSVKEDGTSPLLMTNKELMFSSSGICLTGDKPLDEATHLTSACSSTDSTSTTTITTTEDTDQVLDNLDYSSLPDSVVLDHGYADDLSDTENELKIVEEPTPVRSRGGFGRRGEGCRPFRSRRRGHRRAFNIDRSQTVVKVEKLANPEGCRRNLAVHILDVQSDMASKLDTIEQELSVLESEYGNEASSQAARSEDQLQRLLQSLKNSSEELLVIQKFAGSSR